MKMSELPDTGCGLFAARDFNPMSALGNFYVDCIFHVPAGDTAFIRGGRSPLIGSVPSVKCRFTKDADSSIQWRFLCGVTSATRAT